MNKTAITLLLAALSSTSALADPVGLNLLVTCPRTNVIRDAITHFGSYVAGYGKESLQGGNETGIFFKSTAKLPFGVPNELSSYQNKSVHYDSVRGEISCDFSSSNTQYPDLTVSYTLTNGAGATVVRATAEFIELELLVGAKG